MFAIAVILGVYAELLFFLGIAGVFYNEIIVWFTLIYFPVSLFLGRKFMKPQFFRLPKQKIIILLIFLLLLQILINVIGALAPELSFDALWYHLTLPKLYLEKHAVFYIPGGLLYYSAMPKLGEMFFAAGLSFGGETVAKLIHFGFGIITACALYLFSRKYFIPFISLLAVVIFYANIVVAWESTVAYIDLIRTFFELMALWGFVNWWETKKNKWLVLSAILMGFAITTKLLAIGSFLIILVLLCYKAYRTRRIKLVIIYCLLTLIIPLPWLLFSYINTGNFVYPFFSDIYSISPEPLSLWGFLREIWNVLLFSSDPISPLYLITLPLLVFYYPKLPTHLKPVVWYSLLAIVMWYFTPRTGGGRFLLPYLPACSLLCAGVLYQIGKSVSVESRIIYNALIGLILFTAVITICYRGVATIKFLPVVAGQQSRESFLQDNLNFTFGDFYDTDNYFKNMITTDDTVLLYGFHNLYYVDFPYVHASWVQAGDRFNYIAVQKGELPARFADWQLIHMNAKTMVKLYKSPKSAPCKKQCVY